MEGGKYQKQNQLGNHWHSLRVKKEKKHTCMECCCPLLCWNIGTAVGMDRRTSVHLCCVLSFGSGPLPRVVAGGKLAKESEEGNRRESGSLAFQTSGDKSFHRGMLQCADRMSRFWGVNSNFIYFYFFCMPFYTFIHC